MNNKIKNLEMIENIIERMARNCFQLKGWAMTLVATVSALAVAMIVLVIVLKVW